MSVHALPFLSQNISTGISTQAALKGNLADGRRAGGEDSVGAIHSEENNVAIQLEDGTAASLEANKAMCHKALFDILISEKFAMLCDLLAATFHVNTPDDVTGLQIINAKMRNGNYAQNPALLDHDIKKAPNRGGKLPGDSCTYTTLVECNGIMLRHKRA